MRSRLSLAFAVGIAAALIAPGAASAGFSVLVNDDFFNPNVVTPHLGDSVAWAPNGATTVHNHTVTQDQALFDSGPETNNLHYVIAPSAGTFLYHCKVHGAKGGVGMSGVVKVAPEQRATKLKRGEIQIGVGWAHSGSDTGDRYDVRYKGPGTEHRYKSWLKNTTDEEGSFGAGNEPVKVKPGKKYSFQARSETSLTGKHSDWSPALKVTAGV